MCPIISDIEDEYYNLHRYETLAIYAPSYIAKEILGRILENDKENDEPEFWVHEDSDVFLLYNDYEEVVITIGYDGMISVESARTNDGRILRSESVLSYVYDEFPQKDVKKISNNEFSVLVFGFKDECEDIESYDKECCENCHGCEECCAECDVCGCEDYHCDDTNDVDNKPNDDIEKPDDNKPAEDDSSNNEEPNDSTGNDKNQTDDSNKPSVEQEKKSSNNYLNKLIPSFGSIVFDKAKCEYFITVPYETENINFELMVEDKKASANIEGNNNLEVGENIITITVTAEDGNKREYKIIVTRKDENIILSSNSKLKKLMVKGYNLEFDSDKYEYNLKIHNEDFLDITYITQDEKSDVTIVGNNNLKDKSVITVTVVAEDGSTTSYTINIKKTVSMNIILLIIFIVIIIIAILTVYLIYQRKKLKSI